MAIFLVFTILSVEGLNSSAKPIFHRGGRDGALPYSEDFEFTEHRRNQHRMAAATRARFAEENARVEVLFDEEDPLRRTEAIDEEPQALHHMRRRSSATAASSSGRRGRATFEAERDAYYDDIDAGEGGRAGSRTQHQTQHQTRTELEEEEDDTADDYVEAYESSILHTKPHASHIGCQFLHEVVAEEDAKAGSKLSKLGASIKGFLGTLGHAAAQAAIQDEIANIRPERINCRKAREAIEQLVQDGQVSIETAYTARSAFKIAIYTAHDVVSEQIRSANEWEGPETRELASRMNQLVCRHNGQSYRPTFIDIGGNIGWFSMSMLADGHDVITFEPMHANLLLIRASACLNPGFTDRLKLYHVGLGDRHDRCFMVSNKDNIGDGHAVCEAAMGGREAMLQYLEKDHLIIRHNITVVALDRTSFVPPPLSVMKIDIEGHEQLAMAGMWRWLSSARRPAFIASEAWTHMHGGVQRSEYIATVQSLNYDLFSTDLELYPTDKPTLREIFDHDEPSIIEWYGARIPATELGGLRGTRDALARFYKGSEGAADLGVHSFLKGEVHSQFKGWLPSPPPVDPEKFGLNFEEYDEENDDARMDPEAARNRARDDAIDDTYYAEFENSLRARKDRAKNANLGQGQGQGSARTSTTVIYNTRDEDSSESNEKLEEEAFENLDEDGDPLDVEREIEVTSTTQQQQQEQQDSVEEDPSGRKFEQQAVDQTSKNGDQIDDN